MFFFITITSKEKTTLKKFLSFFSKINFLTLPFLKLKQKKQKKKIVTVLKSPHINKTAQEQFEFKFFSRQILLFSVHPFFYFGIFKRITKKRFPGVNIKLIYIFNKKKQNKILISFLNPDNIRLKKKIKNTNFKNYLKMFDAYGEICLRTF